MQWLLSQKGVLTQAAYVNTDLTPNAFALHPTPNIQVQVNP